MAEDVAPKTLLPRRGEPPLRIALRCLAIAVIAITLLIVLFMAFEVVRLVVDPSARE